MNPTEFIVVVLTINSSFSCNSKMFGTIKSLCALLVHAITLHMKIQSMGYGLSKTILLSVVAAFAAMAALRGHKLPKDGRFSTAPPGYIDACVITKTCATPGTDIRVPSAPWSVMPTSQQQCAGCSVSTSIIKLASKVSDALVPREDGHTGELPAMFSSSTCPLYTTFSSPTSYCPSAALPKPLPLYNIGCWLNISDLRVATIPPGTVSDTMRNSSDHQHLNKKTSVVGPTAAATVTVRSNTEAVAHWITNSYTSVPHALPNILTTYDWPFWLVQVANKTRDTTAAAAQHICKVLPAVARHITTCTTPGTITIIIIKCLVWLYCYWYFTTHGASGLHGLVAVECPLQESVIIKPNIWTVQQLVQLALVWSATSCLDTTSHLAAAVVYRLAAAGALYLGPMQCSRLCECVYVLHCDLALYMLLVCDGLLSAAAVVIGTVSRVKCFVKLVYHALARCLKLASAHLVGRLHQLHNWFHDSCFAPLVSYMDFNLVVDLPGLSDDDIHALLAVTDNRLCVCLGPHGGGSGGVLDGVFHTACDVFPSSGRQLYQRTKLAACCWFVHVFMPVHHVLHAVSAHVQFTACKGVCVFLGHTAVSSVSRAVHRLARGLQLQCGQHGVWLDVDCSADAYGKEGGVAGGLDTGQLVLQDKLGAGMMVGGAAAAAAAAAAAGGGGDCFSAVHDNQLAVRQPLISPAACPSVPVDGLSCVSSDYLGCSLLVSEGGDVVVVVAVGGGQCQKGIGDDGLQMVSVVAEPG